MIKIKYIFSVIFCILFIIRIDAQEPDFRILGIKGSVDFQSKSGSWKSIKTGDQLTKNDKIKVGVNSYLGMVHSTGRTVEIKKEGTFNIAKLSKEVSSFKSSTSQRFAKFVIDEISSGKELLAEKKYKRSMQLTGAVERAEGENITYTGTLSALTGSNLNEYSALNEAVDFLIKTDKNYIRVKYPRASYFLDDNIDFVWYKNSTVSVYEYKIIDINNNIVYSKKTSDTTININLNDIKLVKGLNYYWYVQSDNIKSDQFCINRINDYDRKRIDDDIEPLLDATAKGDDAASFIILASVYEDENIKNRAIDAYERALSNEPDVEGYKTLYARYLSRIGLDDEALKLIK
jgi:tetratricopeptide (TPR) repeat protein